MKSAERRRGLREAKARLVVRFEPQPDESLHGWIVRLAQANCYKNAWAIHSLVRRSSAANCYPTRQDQFAQLVDGSPESFEKYLRGGKAFYYGGELDLGLGYFSVRPNVCPACLAERAIIRSVWHMKIWQYCPQHACKLLQACPYCGTSLGAAVTRCGNLHCRENLTNAACDRTPSDIINVVGMLGDVSAGRRSDRFQSLGECFQHISLRDLVHVIALLSRPLLQDRDHLSKEASVHEQLKIAEDVFSDWPHSYHQYLDRVRSTCINSDSDPVRGSYLQREFPFLFRGLTKDGARISGDILNEFKEELAVYVEDRIPQRLDVRTTLTGKPSRWISLNGAGRELGFSNYEVMQAEKENAIQTTKVSVNGLTRHFVERDYIRGCYDELSTRAKFKAEQRVVSLGVAENLLRLNRPAIQKLVDAGLLEGLSYRGATWCKVASIRRLLARLAQLAKRPAGDGPRIKLGSTLKVSTAEPQDALELVLAGKLPLTRDSGPKRGFRCYSIARNELTNLFPLTPDGYVSVAEASESVNLPKNDFWAAIRSGLLPAEQHPRQGFMIEKAMLAAFRRKYITSDELKERYSIHGRTVYEELADSAASVKDASRVWRRCRAIAILDRRFSSIATK